VFSSAFRSDDEARAEFFQHLRAIGDLPPDAPDPETRVIRMRVGRTRRAWVRNCVAIGLSGGFIEPLESTAIYVIEMAARWLVSHLPDRQVNPAFAARFNRLMDELYTEVRNFIVSHYYTSNRPEPFWRAARGDIEIPDSLRENLELWRHALPNITDTAADRLFNYWNYTFTLWPKGYFRGVHFPLEGSIRRRDWDAFGAKLARHREHLMATLPNHYDLLSRIRAGTAAESQGQGIAVPPGAQRRASVRPAVPIP
jgi:tryptophan halogenase